MASVFTTRTQDRFYHFPEGTEVAEGDLELRSLRGERRHVDSDAAAAFEVSEARAKELVKAEVADFTQRATGALSALGSVLRAASNKSVPSPSPEQTPPKNVVADLLGITPEQLSGDPQAVREGMKAVVAGLGAALADAAGQTPDATERTEERVERVREALGQMPDGEGGDAMVEGLKSLAGVLNDPETSARVRDAADKLSEATGRLQKGHDDLAQALSEEPDA